MNEAETPKRDLDLLPSSMLVSTLLSEVAAYAIEDDLPADLAEQHDHYLYGVSKK